VDGQVVDVLRLRKPVLLARHADRLVGDERVEHLLRRARVDEDDSVGRAEAACVFARTRAVPQHVPSA